MHKTLGGNNVSCLEHSQITGTKSNVVLQDEKQQIPVLTMESSFDEDLVVLSSPPETSSSLTSFSTGATGISMSIGS